jgi:hypothetical protein
VVSIEIKGVLMIVIRKYSVFKIFMQVVIPVISSVTYSVGASEDAFGMKSDDSCHKDLAIRYMLKNGTVLQKLKFTLKF